MSKQVGIVGADGSS